MIQPLLRDNRHFPEKWLWLFAAAFAICWAIARAAGQSITIDEAQTYLFFVRQSQVWYPFPNNHVLNTLLMWLSTHVFGVSNLTVRGPALLGAALYTVACSVLCRAIPTNFSVRFATFMCLLYNPFILDYFVAARGYGLANAFLMTALTALVEATHSKLRLAVSSLALGLSFAANFSFAFVDLSAFLVITGWALRRRGSLSQSDVLVSCILPGLLVALLICGYPLAHWPKGELWWGAHSYSEMAGSLMESSFYRLPGEFLNEFSAPVLLGMLGVLCACQLARTTPKGFVAITAAVIVLAVVAHAVAFRTAKLPLPLGRTGIFFVPLITLLAGSIAAGSSLWPRRAITAVLFCVGVHFLLSLRLSYFREYMWDADAKEVYAELARFNHSYRVRDIGINGIYATALNYYRALSNRESFPEFVPVNPDPPPGKPVYVLWESYARPFIEQEKLVIVYRGRFSETVIAVRPDGPIPIPKHSHSEISLYDAGVRIRQRKDLK